MTRPATSRDVARLAGVSQSTVSLVMTGRGGISEPTRDRVLEAAATLNYRPNLAARSMRTRRSGRLAVVMTVGVLDPIDLLHGVIDAADTAGYVVEVVYVAGDSAQRAQRLGELVDSGQHEGFLSFIPIAIVPHASDAVVLSLSEFDEDMHMTGEFTNARPIDELVDGLVRRGRRRFAHAMGPPDYPSAIARRDAYLAAVARVGASSLGVFEGDWSAASGARVVESLADDAPPFALIAGNDLIATGAMRCAKQRGWRIPEDMSVTGWDDLPQSAYLTPSLTTVVQDREALGAHAIRRLIAAVRGDAPPPPVTGLQRVVWREST